MTFKQIRTSSNQNTFGTVTRWIPKTSVTLGQIDSKRQGMIHITRGNNGRMRSISTSVLSGQATF
jgi:hypothetical protein